MFDYVEYVWSNKTTIQYYAIQPNNMLLLFITTTLSSVQNEVFIDGEKNRKTEKIEK
jgi:hypothetical protein